LKLFNDDLRTLIESTGLKIKSHNIGMIKTGNQINTTDAIGNPITIDETKEGTELEFEIEPTQSQLSVIKEIVKGNRDTDSLKNSIQNRESFKTSTLYGMTQAQLESYIDTNVTTLANAKTYLKKLSAVVLYLVKQTKLDQ